MAESARLSTLTDQLTLRESLFEEADGTWQLSRSTDPDRALLSALAQEYVRLDEHVATLPDRLHVAWLEDIVQVPRLPVVPDKVIAAATVEPKLAPAVVPAGTTLRGGKDAFGNERRYRTADALTAHGATLAGVRVMVTGGPDTGQPGLAYGADPLPHMLPLSEPERLAGPPAPHVLRIYSSSLAFDKDDLTVRLGFDGASSTNVGRLRSSGRWRWPLPDGSVSVPVGGLGTGTAIEVTMSGGCVDPAGGVPWIECVVQSDEPVPLALEITDVNVRVTSRSGLTPDAAFANRGAVDVTKEFEPYGITASRGDAFYVRCDEALSKPVDTFFIKVELVQARSGGKPLTSLDLDGALGFISGAVINYSTVETYSFHTLSSTSTSGSSNSSSSSSAPSIEWQRLAGGAWQGFGGPVVSIGDHSGAMSGTGSDETAVSGQVGRYVRAAIVSGDLGWSGYQHALATFASMAVADPDNSPGMPTPLVAAKYRYLTVGYTTLDTPATRVESWSGWRHQVKPAGAWRPFRTDVDALGNTGMVAFGLNIGESVFGSSVSIYAELTSPSPCGVDDLAQPHWEWWDGSAWNLLLVADGTNRMRESGLIRFVAPNAWAEGCEDVSADAGRWIRFVTDQPKQIGPILAAIPDAVVAEYVSAASDPASDPSPATALPAGTIKGTLSPIVGVKKVTNLASVRGRGPETDAAYRSRAAALVRHRGRAINPWDYEQIVLTEFPEVAAVRCLPHTDSAGHSYAGSVGLVVIPDQPGTAQPLPSVSLGSRIRVALQPIMPMRAIASILCPQYAPATINASVLLRSGVAAITGKAEILAALETLLHPTGTVPIRWGQSLYLSTLIAALENLAPVDKITSIQMFEGATETEIIDVNPCFGLYCSSGDHSIAVEEQL
jgi:hypothetical protein